MTTKTSTKWSQQDMDTLLDLLNKRTSTLDIATALNRSENAIIHRRRKYIYDNANDADYLSSTLHVTAEDIANEIKLEEETLQAKRDLRKEKRAQQVQSAPVQQVVQPAQPQVKQQYVPRPLQSGPKQKQYTITEKMEMYNFLSLFAEDATVKSYKFAVAKSVFDEIRANFQ